MDSDVVLAKVEVLRRCVERIRSKVPESVELLTDNYDTQDILCINLERAVQTCVDIGSVIIAESDVAAPNTMAEVFESLEALGYVSADTAEHMKKAVGFRNIAVHAYEKIDWGIVYSIVTERLIDFSQFAEQVCEKLGDV